jgi:hypothetical protein
VAGKHHQRVIGTNIYGYCSPARIFSYIFNAYKTFEMKKQPRKTKQWADEAYSSLVIAWKLLKEEYSNPNENETLELVRFAPAIAGTNRGIADKNIVKKAYDFIYERIATDLKNKEEDEPIHYSIMFLLAYLDSHISFGVLSEKKVDDIMEYLSEHYDINYEP